jgi:GNAT superfamily N-acetyltransferase
MASNDRIPRADLNLLHAVKVWANAATSSSVWEADDVVFASSGVPIRSFNNVFLTGPLASPNPHLSEAIEHFESRGVPFRLRVRDDINGVTEDVVAAAGFERRGGIPSLVLNPLPTAPRSLPGLEIRGVTDVDTLRDHVTVVASGFDWPISLLSQVFTEVLMADPSWRGYIGYEDKQPVAAAQLIVTDGVAGLYYVATLEEHRHRGFGEAMSWWALNEGAAAACDMASLQASPMGLPVYERMGFTTLSYYRTYVRDRYDAGPR